MDEEEALRLYELARRRAVSALPGDRQLLRPVRGLYGSGLPGKYRRPLFHRPSPGSEEPAARTGVFRSRTGRSGNRPDQYLSDFKKTIADLGLEDTVIPIVSGSAVAAEALVHSPEPGLHRRWPYFEAAFTDYSSWVSHLMPGGYLVIHDIFPDPAKGGQALTASTNWRSRRDCSRSCRWSKHWAR